MNHKTKEVKTMEKGRNAQNYGVTIIRLLKMLRSFFPVMLPLASICIVFNAIISSIPSIFMQNVISLIEKSWKSGNWEKASPEILRFVVILVGLYIFSLLSSIIYTQIMAYMSQGFLKKLRITMFERMQGLPISYFDTHNHGDIMSYYTNDVDTLRQMISQSFPQLLISSVTVISISSIMLYYSMNMTVVVALGIVVMLFVTRHVAGNSAKYFIRQQVSIAKTEGYVEEMMNGQKVVKVFNHEKESEHDFDKINDQLYHESRHANRYANILGPIIMNVGNLLYVAVALVSGIFLIVNIHNISFSGLPFGISIVVPFLNMTKQFSGNINQVSHQVNAVVMGLAGANRIFYFLDQKQEDNEGYVELVNAKEINGEIVESEVRTGTWAWKHLHQDDGTLTYTKLEGAVRLSNVDFSYVPGKEILHDISLYANPGEKVAFVGATGAGKTTIANLLNRFYDIADGKIRYDGININKIKKDGLRRSIGIVLQDTNLFSETVMNNIRYGRLDATDDECILAAKLVGAHDFITRLPEGYNTFISGNGANLSQGQRQLLAIARAAVADPPVMILDEATSSIDTRTEAIVQQGMDALMLGRTVFVIAHRLSTIKNADVIMVMDHGRIIERGTHEQLIKEKGQYYQLYTGAFELE